MAKTLKKSKSRAARHWYTVAYFTAEGQPIATHTNFVRHYMQLSVLREDVQRVMSADFLRRGAHAAVIWAGELSEWEALRGPQAPLYHVYEGGRVER